MPKCIGINNRYKQSMFIYFGLPPLGYFLEQVLSIKSKTPTFLNILNNNVKVKITNSGVDKFTNFGETSSQ